MQKRQVQLSYNSSLSSTSHLWYPVVSFQGHFVSSIRSYFVPNHKFVEKSRSFIQLRNEITLFLERNERNDRPPICLITSMITDQIGRHEVLLPITHNHYNLQENKCTPFSVKELLIASIERFVHFRKSPVW